MCRFPEKGEAGYRSFLSKLSGKSVRITLSWMFRGHENLRVSVSGYPCAIRSSQAARSCKGGRLRFCGRNKFTAALRGRFGFMDNRVRSTRGNPSSSVSKRMTAAIKRASLWKRLTKRFTKRFTKTLKRRRN